jgi:hypothetical protein
VSRDERAVRIVQLQRMLFRDALARHADTTWPSTHRALLQPLRSPPRSPIHRE